LQQEEIVMPVYVVANPKGGAGKSTLATNLAGWLARQGHAVALGDWTASSARQWLALRPRQLPPIHTWDVADAHDVLRTAQGLHPPGARHPGRPAWQAAGPGAEDRRPHGRAAAAQPVRPGGHACLSAQVLARAQARRQIGGGTGGHAGEGAHPRHPAPA
jgi:hypothetical protein